MSSYLHFINKMKLQHISSLHADVKKIYHPHINITSFYSLKLTFGNNIFYSGSKFV